MLTLISFAFLLPFLMFIFYFCWLKIRGQPNQEDHQQEIPLRERLGPSPRVPEPSKTYLCCFHFHIFMFRSYFAVSLAILLSTLLRSSLANDFSTVSIGICLTAFLFAILMGFFYQINVKLATLAGYYLLTSRYSICVFVFHR